MKSVWDNEGWGTRYSRKLIQRELGTTGVLVSFIGLGGVGILQEGEDDDQCIEIIHEAIDLGVNFIDTAPGYKRSEWRVGQVTATRRDEVFIATKVEERSRDGILQQVENSLKVLHTDQLDLLQIHHIYEEDDVEHMERHDGIFGTLKQLKDEGVTRFIGLTGHPDYPKVTRALELYDWDTFMCFVNPSPFAIRAFEVQMPIARRKGIGLIGMKAFGGCWPARLIGEGPCQAGAPELLRYALTMPLDRPIDVVIPGVWDIDELRQNMRVAAEFAPMPPEECRELEGKLRVPYTPPS